MFANPIKARHAAPRAHRRWFTRTRPACGPVPPLDTLAAPGSPDVYDTLMLGPINWDDMPLYGGRRTASATEQSPAVAVDHECEIAPSVSRYGGMHGVVAQRDEEGGFEVWLPGSPSLLHFEASEIRAVAR